MIPIYSDHFNLGFNQGTRLPDPHGLLTGTGKLIRHIDIKSPAFLLRLKYLKFVLPRKNAKTAKSTERRIREVLPDSASKIRQPFADDPYHQPDCQAEKQSTQEKTQFHNLSPFLIVHESNAERMAWVVVTRRKKSLIALFRLGLNNK